MQTPKEGEGVEMMRTTNNRATHDYLKSICKKPKVGLKKKHHASAVITAKINVPKAILFMLPPVLFNYSINAQKVKEDA